MNLTVVPMGTRAGGGGGGEEKGALFSPLKKMERSSFCLFQSAFFLYVLKESAKLHALAPTRLTHIRKFLACALSHFDFIDL